MFDIYNYNIYNYNIYNYNIYNYNIYNYIIYNYIIDSIKAYNTKCATALNLVRKHRSIP